MKAYGLFLLFLQKKKYFFLFCVWPILTPFLCKLGPKITIFRGFTNFFFQNCWIAIKIIIKGPWTNNLSHAEKILPVKQKPHLPKQTISSWMEYQPKLKEKCMFFYIVFQVLEVLLIKIYQMQPPVLLFLVVLY